MVPRPEFLILSEEDCQKVLLENRVGRIAFTHGGSVDIQPIGYVASGKWIFLRSAYGTKLAALLRNPYVAFEVDRVAGPYDWESVVVRGTVYMLPTDGAPIEQRELARAIDAMRRVMPEAFSHADPTPDRDQVYGLYIHEITGRKATVRDTEKS